MFVFSCWVIQRAASQMTACVVQQSKVVSEEIGMVTLWATSRRFLSFHTSPLNVRHPQKCELCFFVGAPGTKYALEGGGGYFVTPFMNKTSSTKMFIAMYCFAFAYYSITTSYNHGQIYSNNVVFINGLISSFVSQCNFYIDRHVFDRTLQVFIRRQCRFTESNYLYHCGLLVIGASQTWLMVGGFRSKALLAL